MEPADHVMYRAAIHSDTEVFEMVIRKMSRPLFAVAFEALHRAGCWCTNVERPHDRCGVAFLAPWIIALAAFIGVVHGIRRSRRHRQAVEAAVSAALGRLAMHAQRSTTLKVYVPARPLITPCSKCLWVVK